MTTQFDTNWVYETAKPYVIQVFPGEHDERTTAVGFFTEDGEQIANTISDPEVIIAVAHRLVQIADEIAENQRADRERVAAQIRELGPGATMQDLVEHRRRLADAGVADLSLKRARRAPQDG